MKLKSNHPNPEVKITYLLYVLPCFLVAFFSYKSKGFQLDDALIYLRYIRNFQNGYGLVYNPGEQFNGLTSPLFSYLMVLGSFFTKNLQILSIASSGCFLAIAAIIGGKLFSKTSLGQLFTSLSIASFGYFYLTFGMETPLFLLLLSLSLYLYKVNSRYLFLSLAFLVITRSEGILLAAPLTIALLVRNKKLPNINILLLSILIFLTPYIINYINYGDFIAATANAKIGQGKSGLWGYGWIFFNIDYLFDWAFSGRKFLAISLIVTSIYGGFLLIRNRVALLSMVFLVLLLGFYGCLNIPNYHWYYAPFFFFFIIFSCSGIESFAKELLRYPWPSNQTFVFLITLTALPFFYINTISLNGGGRNEPYAQVGTWLKENTNQNASIAMVEIGTIGWYSDRRIIDILGLVNKFNADYITKGDVTSWIKDYQPDYILKHEPIWPHEKATIELEKIGAYSPDPTFNQPGFVLLKKTDKYTDGQIANSLHGS